MNQDKYPQLEKYDLIGFASPVEFFGLPKFIYDWFSDLPFLKTPKLAFLLLTFGNITGTSILQLRSLVQDKGFRVIAGHTLHMPDNFPISRGKGFTASSSPNKQELARFHLFSSILKDLIESIKEGHEILEASFKLSLINYFFNIPDRYAAKRSMGFKFVNEELCTQCSLCSRECPYNAIEMDCYPVFTEELCYGCWRCYNICPEKAIFTNKIKGKGYYSGPGESLLEKFDLEPSVTTESL
jgi:ferredoxin